MMKRGNKRKRCFDVLFSLCVLLIGFPVFCIIGCAVKLSSKGPIFYKSRRIGREGKLFTFWKFRSMYLDADARLKGLLQSDPVKAQEWRKFAKLKNDPRVTPLGKFLRKTSFDELPQFWNVLKGDLSLVGPRPYLPREWENIVSSIGKEATTILAVRPGLTGLWQTSGRSFLTFQQRLQLDLAYVKHRSFTQDLQLIAKTIPQLIFPKGAF